MHLAQFNIARAIAPLDAPELRDFVARLDEINALADASPGMVWRLRSDADGPQYLHAKHDPRLLVNLTIWQDIDALHAFTYRSDHAELFKARRSWFTKMDGPSFCLWWTPAGTLPDVDEGFRRLALLQSTGPSPESFTFAREFPPPP